MEILVIGGVLFGTVLGRVFKVLILLPAGLLAIILIAINCTLVGHTLLEGLLQTILLITSLEVGYVTGLVSTNLPALAQGLRKTWTTLPHPAPSRTAQPR
ncbi:hypothetical protein CU048_11230 [Beijerinckiaceae bacterium]|nr:hypothetical protein CU048_11230 [Beijerinckiaceae bacterium]